MAGRIRTLNPEMLLDERIAGLEHDTWRLFVWLRLLADAHGDVDAIALQHAGVRARHARDLGEMLGELAAARLLCWDARGGRQLLHLIEVP